MTDDRASADGGETAPPVDVERAGERPPDPPTDAGLERLLSALLEGTDSVTIAYMVRAVLEDGSGRSVGERLVDAIEDQVTVIGSTLEEGFDPENPELDVLIETEHDHGAVASSLAHVGPVVGVAVADVTAAAESELENDAAPAEGADEPEDANAVFNELKEEVGQEGYGQVVEELEDVSFPGGPDPDEEVDLEAETGVSLGEDGDQATGADAAPAGGDPTDGDIDLQDDAAADPADGDIDLQDDAAADGLLGGDESDDGPLAPDEQAIEEAISDVDLDGDGAAANADGAGMGSESPGDGDGPAPDTAGGPASDDAIEGPTVPTPDAPTDDGDDAASPASDDGASPASDDGALSTGEDGAPSTGDGMPSEGKESAASQPTAGADASPAAVDDDMDAFVAELVDALESGAVGEGRRAALRSALGVEESAGTEHLRERVDDLAAATDDVEARLDAVGATTNGPDLAAIERRLTRIESELAELEERHDDDVTRLDTRIDDVGSKLSSRIDRLEDGFDALKKRVKALLQWRERIDEVIRG